MNQIEEIQNPGPKCNRSTSLVTEMNQNQGSI
jgi:hypothetical protein